MGLGGVFEDERIDRAACRVCVSVRLCETIKETGYALNPEAHQRLFMMKSVLLFAHLAALYVAFSQTRMFHFVPENMSWSDAQMYCRQHYTDLATIDDHMDLSELLRSVHQDYIGYVWTGLHRKDANAPWIWSDQSKSTFMPWAPMQPNNWEGTQYCVVVVNGTLNDQDCKNKLPSVCYTEKRKQTARLTVKSSQNVNDPSVKAEILVKIEQILKEKGLTEDAKLSWKIQLDGNVFQKNQKCDVTQQTCL